MDDLSDTLKDIDPEKLDEEARAWQGFANKVAELAIKGGASGVYLYVTYRDKTKSVSMGTLNEIIVTRIFLDMLHQMSVIQRQTIAESNLVEIQKGD